MNQASLVSIIIPCYNQGEYIEECIESVMNQTYRDIEVVIINDGSTDIKTLEKLSNIKNYYGEQIKVIDIENSGVARARNIGIEQCNGEYIVPLDGDDKISQYFVEKCMKIIKNKPEVDIVYSITELFGSVKKLYALPTFSTQRMLRENCVVCTALFRKTDFKLVKGYSENMIYGLEDWDFWLKMIINNKKFYRINEVLFFYRIKQVSRNQNFSTCTEKKILTYKQIFDNNASLFNKYEVMFDEILPSNDKTQIYKRKLIRYLRLIKLKVYLFISKEVR